MQLGRMLLLCTLVTGACRKATSVATLVDLGALDVRGAEGDWAHPADAPGLPLGVWVRVGDVVALTYVDATEGPSAQWHDGGRAHIRRVGQEPPGLVRLDGAARASRGLPEAPDWLVHYGPQPTAGTRWGAWRDDPRFAGRFHPDYPDDLRVVIGAHRDDRYAYEVVWVSLRGCDAVGCWGALLNQPHDVPLTLGDTLAFRYDLLQTSELPPAAAHGDAPDPALVALVRQPELADQVQDDPLWVPDVDVPIAERLTPVHQWVRVGDAVYWVALDGHGPRAVPYEHDGVSQVVPWRPAGMSVLSEAEIAALGLPATPDGRQHPPASLFGTWRLDARLEELLVHDDPDVLWVHVTDGQDANTLRVAIRACGDAVCEAVLLDDAAGRPAGSRVSFDLDDRVGGLPVVVTAGTRP
jgi:hypothetical protein